MPKNKRPAPVYERIRQILESARSGLARSVNTTQVVANWLIGREIVEEEQRGKKKAGYGDVLLEDLATRLAAEFGAGYSGTNLRWFRQFYLEYPSFMSKEIHHAPRDKSISLPLADASAIHHAVRDESGGGAIPLTLCALSGLNISDEPRRKSGRILHAVCGDLFKFTSLTARSSSGV